MSIERLIGVYDANGSAAGELAYWVRARLGRGHCALCDVTHGLFLEKDEWKQCRAGLPVPLDLVHLDERSPEVEQLTAGRVPCIVAQTGTGFEMFLTSTEIAACDGDPIALSDAIVSRLRDREDRAGS
jgi:hypothetical protein